MDYRMSCDAINGRVAGAGSGGFFPVYCLSGQASLISAMEKLDLCPTWFTFDHEGAKMLSFRRALMDGSCLSGSTLCSASS